VKATAQGWILAGKWGLEAWICVGSSRGLRKGLEIGTGIYDARCTRVRDDEGE
jgi:hypothetical protein